MKRFRNFLRNYLGFNEVKAGQAEMRDLYINGFETIAKMLEPLNANMEKLMSLESDALDALEAQTAAIAGAEDSAESAFLRLADQIASLKNSQTDPATAARITAAADALRDRAAKLAAAVAAVPA